MERNYPIWQARRGFRKSPSLTLPERPSFHQLWHRKKNLPLSRAMVELIDRHVDKVPIARRVRR